MSPTLVRRPTYATPADAIARAKELAPGFRERVPQAEQLRRLPDETVRELHESGLFLLLAPRSMGGSELNYDDIRRALNGNGHAVLAIETLPISSEALNDAFSAGLYRRMDSE